MIAIVVETRVLPPCPRCGGSLLDKQCFQCGHEPGFRQPWRAPDRQQDSGVVANPQQLRRRMG